MLKISTKSRYALRAIIDIAMNYAGKPVLLKDIARRQEISEKYLENIVASLKSAGLVKSVRGASGGYLLAAKPAEIKIMDIIKIFEGPISIVECVKNPKYCSRVKKCATRNLWKEISDSISKILESKTLKEMIDENKQDDVNDWNI